MKRHLRIDKLDVGYVACEYGKDGYPGKEYGLSTLSELHVLIDTLFGEARDSISIQSETLPEKTETSDAVQEDVLDFHMIEAFESCASNQRIQLPKHQIEVGEAGIRIYYPAYKINIYTTKAEILRILKLSDDQKKELLRRFGQVAYAHKAAVLRTLLEVPDLETMI